MTCNITELKEKVLKGGEITKDEAMWLCKAPLNELSAAADEIRKVKCGNIFDICAVINGKCGHCSEDCRFCVQSVYYETAGAECFPLLSAGDILKGAKENEEAGVLRYSVVTGGKRLSTHEVDKVCEAVRLMREKTSLHLCVSLGLLSEEDFIKLKQAGVTRIHCNLETSSRYFSNVCTTHTYGEKIETLKAAKHAGLSICSGGILGLGETMEDRIDMAITARELGVRSVPVNVLNPIPGTPFGNNKPLTNEELCLTVAIFRFLLPDAAIRLAAGRGLLPDKGEACFKGGANAAISGDMLTTSGISVATDIALLKKMGYVAGLAD